jgi:5-dehydro-2-deoxygluconokinase
MTPPVLFEVLTMGRVGVDVYPAQTGSLVNVTTFHKFLGGTATNVAVAAARLGRRAAVVTRTGADPFGEFVHVALTSYGVDDRFVTAVPGLPTPVTFCEILSPDDVPIYFYRYPKAPDLEIHPWELDVDSIAGAGVFWVTGTGLCAEPSRTSTIKALEVRAKRHATVLDLDFRPQFWASVDDARQALAQALPHVTVAVGNIQEATVATGDAAPDEAADRLLELGAELAVVKLGAAGVLAKTADERIEVPPVKVEVLNGLGAGDGFGGALCHGLLEHWPLDLTIGYANAAGAIVASRLACSEAMPTNEEIQALMSRTTNG